MKRFVFELSDELWAAMEGALSGRHRNPAVEDWLWRIGEIREAARKSGITRKPRPTRGRPKSVID